MAAFGFVGGCGSPKRDLGGYAGQSSAGSDPRATSGSGGLSGSGGRVSGSAGHVTAVGDGGEAGEVGSAPCTPGERKSCYESADGTHYSGQPAANQTTCRLGESKCGDDAKWGACLGAVAPEAADTCEAGNDANCNGTPNENCTCANGQKRPCGSAVGNCKLGEQTCAASTWGPCVGEVKPAAADTCDKGDDANCNGKVNDGCDCANGDTQPCGKNIGSCKPGVSTCVKGTFSLECVGGVKPAAADTCEPGNDADCDGTPNTGCGCTGTGTVPCGKDVGTCKKGTQACVNGTLSGCMGSVEPTANDTCFAANAANDTNCNGTFRDGCTQCVATDPANICGDVGCGKQTCNGGTGKWNACTGDGTTLRCNPNAPDTRQVCGSAGAWVLNACPANTVCRNNGAECDWIDGQSCSTSTDCASGTCTSFYVDADKDGYRGNGTLVKFCGASKTGYVTIAANKGDDCNDTNADINPIALESCDGVDNNCDGKIDFAGNPGLTLSGNPIQMGPGHWPSVASVGSSFAVAYINGSASYSADKLYLQMLSQANAAGAKVEVDPATPNLSVALASDGSGGAGILYYRDTSGSNGEVWLRRATSAGLSSTAAVKVANARRGSGPSYAAWATGGRWMFASSGGANGGASWGWGAGFDGTNLGAEITLNPTGYSQAAVAASGSTFGFVYGASGGTLDFSARNSAFAETSHVTFSATTSGYRPVIAARAGGGFAILWNDSNGYVWFEETSLTGSASCGPISLASSATFTSLAPTKRGYLAVGITTNGTVIGQEILGGCTLGKAFPNIGTGAAYGWTNIAPSSTGFAVVWDDGSNVYSRTFGTNLCD